jgi:AcrR family transcriptional regulator
MNPQEVRQKLIAKTISVIAKEGLDKTTTKSITYGTGINEAYIYRFFDHKEDLLTKAFEAMDEELVKKMKQHISVINMSELEFELRWRVLFEAVWSFLCGNKDKCLAYVRYYYSPYFTKYSAFDHKSRYAPLVEKLSVVFTEGANVWMLLNHVLNVMMDFAVKVFSEAVDNNDDTTEHVFRLVYCSILPYLKKEEQKDMEEAIVCRCR